MPPRHAYWTILIGDSPTAFRARERDELLPTFERLRAKQPDAVLKWFERGRLWASPEEARGPAPSPTGPQDRRGQQERDAEEGRLPRGVQLGVDVGEPDDAVDAKGHHGQAEHDQQVGHDRAHRRPSSSGCSKGRRSPR